MKEHYPRIDENKIMFNDDKLIVFEYKIKKILQFEKVVAVLLESPSGTILHENVFCVDNEKATVVWQIPKIKYAKENSYYSNIYKIDSLLGLYDKAGYELTVEPETGKIVKQEFIK